MMVGHWRRLIAQLLILGSMAMVYAVSSDLYVSLVSLSIIVLPIACWTVFGVLLWTSHQAPDIQSLRDRVDDMLTASLASTAGAIVTALVLGRVLGFITAPIGPYITIGIGFLVVEVSIPALRFLQTWRWVYLPVVMRRRNRDKPPPTV